MVRVEFFADEQLYAALQSAAEQRSMSVEDYARLTLQQAVDGAGQGAKKYSFIGIGNSGRGDLSQKAEENLRSADRKEGWSLP